MANHTTAIVFLPFGPSKAKGLRSKEDEGPSLETSSFCLFFSGSNITTQHSIFTLVLLQTVLLIMHFYSFRMLLFLYGWLIARDSCLWCW